MKGRILRVIILIATLVLIHAFNTCAEFVPKAETNDLDYKQRDDPSGKCGNDLTWELDLDTGVLEISGTGDMYDFSSTGYDQPWHSFIDQIKSAVLHDGVTYIGNSSFLDCTEMTSVVIPNTVSVIGHAAFLHTRLKSVVIPDSVTVIGSWAFNLCQQLSSVSLGNVTTIEENAFYHAGLTEVTIPSSVTLLGRLAFGGCSSLTSVKVLSTSLSRETFSSCEKLSTVVFENNITYLDQYVFHECKKLNSITIPDSVVKIDQGAFQGCSALNSLVIPRSVTYIGEDAFAASGLNSVEIPDSVSFVGTGAFANCGQLTSINVAPGNPYYSSINGLLLDKNASALLQCPATATSVVIPDSVTTVGDYAFYYCRNLDSVKFGSSVGIIGKRAFFGCSWLVSVAIPGSVTSIGTEAFCKCSQLESVCFSGTNDPGNNSTNVFRFTLVSTVSVLDHYNNATFCEKEVVKVDSCSDESSSHQSMSSVVSRSSVVSSLTSDSTRLQPINIVGVLASLTMFLSSFLFILQ